jgi:hypothetical protein
MCNMKKALICAGITAALMFFFVVSGRTQTSSRTGPAHVIKPEIIYITDFVIDTGDVSRETGLLRRPRPLREDPAARAARLVEALSGSLTQELRNRSIPAQRIFPNQEVPNRGWLVSGEFLEVDEGNRLRRAIVGFGVGATDMQVEVTVMDLGSGSREPFAVFGTDSRSGRGPGAVVFRNPYVAAAKFVLSKRASEKDIRKTARQIADTLAECIKESGAHSK